MGHFNRIKGEGWECVGCGERIPFSDESLMRLHYCVIDDEQQTDIQIDSIIEPLPLPIAQPKPPVNLKVEFAHGVTHLFNKMDAQTFADFDEWLTCVDRKEQFYILENGGQKYYLNREFICAVTVREV